MTREEAIAHLAELCDSVREEFCLDGPSAEHLDATTRAALGALGVTEEEIAEVL